MMMLDFDRMARLRMLRDLALVGGLVCIVGLIANLFDLTWPADLILGTGVVVFFVHALNYSVDMHEMRLVDDEDLHQPPKEVRMKK